MIYELLASIIGIVGAMIIIDEMGETPKVDDVDMGRKSSGYMTAVGVVMVTGSLAWLWNLIT